MSYSDMTYAWFDVTRNAGIARIMHMSYRSKTYTWNDVILVKRSMIRVFSIMISRMTRDRTRTMVLRNSRSIQKHRTGCELSYCDMREAGCAFAWRSHVTKSCLSWDISDVTSCNALMSRLVSLRRHVVCPSDVFTSRPPAIRHVKTEWQWNSIRHFWNKHGCTASCTLFISQFIHFYSMYNFK